MTPPVIRSPEERAEILRVLLMLTGGVPTLTTEQSLEVARRQLTPYDVNLLGMARGEDLVLLNACLDAEHGSRERSYAWLYCLLAHAAGEDGELDDRLRALPLPAFASAAECLYALGWVGP